MAEVNRPRRPAGTTGKAKPLYYSGGPPTDSPFKARPRNGRLSRFINNGIDALIAMTVIVGLLYSLVVGTSAQIIASSTNYRPSEAYAEQAAKQLKSFKNHTKLTLDEKGIIAGLQQRFPEINSASVELPLLSTKPVIRLEISPATFQLKSGNNLYVVDAAGIVVDTAADLPQFKSLPEVNDLSGFISTPGHAVLTQTAAGFVSSLIDQLKQSKIPIKSLELPTAAQELYLHTSDRQYFVKFYLDGDVLQESGQFLAARHQFDIKDQQPSQYLDVRVPGKIFYK